MLGAEVETVGHADVLLVPQHAAANSPINERRGPGVPPSVTSVSHVSEDHEVGAEERLPTSLLSASLHVA